MHAVMNALIEGSDISLNKNTRFAYDIKIDENIDFKSIEVKSRVFSFIRESNRKTKRFDDITI